MIPGQMNLLLQLNEDLKNAMRSQDAFRLGVLRMLKSALTYAGLDATKSAGDAASSTDQAVLQVIRKQIKQRQDSISGFEKGGRPELAENEKKEIQILEQYLPQALSPGEISEIVASCIRESGLRGPQAMGAVMKLVSSAAAGRADGKALSDEVRRQLSA